MCDRLQEHAVRTLARLARTEAEPGKLDATERAVTELGQAHRFFQDIRKLDVKRTGIDDSVLKLHVDFCADAHTKALSHLKKVCT